MVLFIACILLSVLMIRVSIYAARKLRLVDHPSDTAHKLHDEGTPFVGGVGVLVALFVALAVLVFNYHYLHQKVIALGLCSIMIFAVGFTDDVKNLDYKPRFIVQAVVAFLMVLIGGVVLYDFGDLLFGLPLQLGIYAIPVTVFAVIGGINAFNMIDGVDGLSGSISLVSLILIGVVAFIAGDQHNLMLTTALAGGVLGFLYFNLRFGTQRYARVFLGDNGSMLLGLMFAWLLVDLSQGSSSAMTPVTALWLFAVPLMDIVGVMLRRAWLGGSPFSSDRHHLHHLLQRAGFRVSEIVFIMAFLHALLGIIGLLGLFLNVSESIMFIGFLLVFTGYFYLTVRPWRFVPFLRHLHVVLNTRLAIAPTASPGVFFGNYPAKDIENLSKRLNEELGVDVNFGVRVYMQPREFSDYEKLFTIKLNIWLAKENCVSEEKLQQYVASLKRRLRIHQGILLRQFTARESDGDPVIYRSGNVFGESKVHNRRRLGPQALVFEICRCE